MPQTPNIYAGVVYQSDGSTPSSSNTVTIVQDKTGDTQTFTTNSLGQYLFDLANFTTDYVDGDFYTIVATGSSATTQELRLKIVSRDVFQVTLLKVKYNG